MSDLESRCLDAFPVWLQSLADDVRAIADHVDSQEGAEPAQRQLIGAINYLFKSLDLIPDGIEDLGFIDDAFVLRVAVAMAQREGGEAPALGDHVAELAGDADLIREFLGEAYPRLERFVGDLTKGTARGRSVDSIFGDAAVRAEFMSELKGWADSYVPPSFGRDVKNLVKLRSFLDAKLPS